MLKNSHAANIAATIRRHDHILTNTIGRIARYGRIYYASDIGSKEGVRMSTNPLPMPHIDGVSHGYATVDGLRIHYAYAGVGAPLVLLHGWPQHWYAWRELISPLSTRGYRVICPDIRGLGWSESAGGGYSLGRLGADIIELLDVLGIERARLVGHDMGGAAGYRACLDYPERIDRFVALATAPPWMPLTTPPGLLLRLWHFFALAIGGRRLAGSPGFVAGRLREWRHNGTFTSDEAELYLQASTAPEAAVAAARYYRGLVSREVPALMVRHSKRRLRVPTLQLNGEFDSLTRGLPDLSSKYAEDMVMETVSGVGHFIAEERPDWVASRIGRFMSI
ncbi:alpha/beta fold hydrolase [Nocardia sp. SC052]|uniref:alpha/beta fold hydrolase n=1 Tax=Nocardia sichangensis TaxID=3385975 RepID=UPI0039A06EF3